MRYVDVEWAGEPLDLPFALEDDEPVTFEIQLPGHIPALLRLSGLPDEILLASDEPELASVRVDWRKVLVSLEGHELELPMSPPVSREPRRVLTLEVPGLAFAASRYCKHGARPPCQFCRQGIAGSGLQL